MANYEEAVRALEERLDEPDPDVYLHARHDPRAIFAALAQSIRESRCEPHEVSAEVTEPGFPDIEVGTVITGICVAHAAGYWLVYEPSRRTFLAFWGSSEALLGAPGIEGGPLYCWSA